MASKRRKKGSAAKYVSAAAKGAAAKPAAKVASKRVASLSDIGDQGLVIFDGDAYYFVTDKQWQALKPTKADPARFPGTVVAATADDTLFVNLDRLQKTPIDHA